MWSGLRHGESAVATTGNLSWSSNPAGIVKPAGAKFMIAEFEKGSSITEMFSLPFSVLCNKATEQKNARRMDDGHNPRSGQETQNSVRCGAGRRTFYDHAYRLRVCR
jgi:hypothetical protein